jgi:hypothetical protein
MTKTVLSDDHAGGLLREKITQPVCGDLPHLLTTEYALRELKRHKRTIHELFQPFLLGNAHG